MAEAGSPRPAAIAAVSTIPVIPTVPVTPAIPGTTSIPAPTDQPIIIPSPTQQNEVRVRFDPEYLITVPGILKIVQISLSLISFILIQVSSDHSMARAKYYSWISMIAVCFSGTLLFLYVFHVVEKYQHKVPWLKIELAYTGTWTVYILVASILCFDMWAQPTIVAAGQIGLRTVVAYAIDFYLKWGGVLRGQMAQEKRVEYQFPSAADSTVVVSPVILPSVSQV